MTDAPVRTRFAPSPTGRLHLGNLRIAVFNQLFARGMGGRFILRIEDTDTHRNVEGATARILEDLEWAGLAPDEGPTVGGEKGPYLQSQRSEAHVRAARELLEAGQAYRCFCSAEELEAARAAHRGSPDGEGAEKEGAEGEDSRGHPRGELHESTGPGCPGGCRTADPSKGEERAGSGDPHVVRFRVPDGEIRIQDAIRGEVSFDGRNVGDFVLLRADGRPTYNLAVVVDDAHMEITHVIRGDGHLSNTPKHTLLFEALGHELPVFAHLPVVLGPEGGRLSKRAGSPGVDELRDQGFHADGVVNYLSLLGWAPGDDREVLTRGELEAEMSLAGSGASPTSYDPDKLRWMSQQHIHRMAPEELANAVEPFATEAGIEVPSPRWVASVGAVQTRMSVFGDAPEALRYLWPGSEVLHDGCKLARSEGGQAVIHLLADGLKDFEPWTSEELGVEVRRLGKEAGVRGKTLFHPLRLVLTGQASGPDLGDIMEGIGRREALARFEAIR